MLGSGVLALWWGINASIPKIIGLGVWFGVSPLGTSGHSDGVPSRGINPQTLKEIASSPKTPTLQGLKILPALKDEACPVVNKKTLQLKASLFREGRRSADQKCFANILIPDSLGVETKCVNRKTIIEWQSQ
jgi:hypothetical protein